MRCWVDLRLLQDDLGVRRSSVDGRSMRHVLRRLWYVVWLRGRAVIRRWRQQHALPVVPGVVV